MSAPLPVLILILALALALGSFLNVCIARLPRHQSIVRPGSRCPQCAAPVRPRDNLPVLSWLLLRGRCRSCGLSISVRYPLVEAGYASLVLASVARFGISGQALGAAIFCFFALGLLVTDAETLLLPDALMLPGALLGMVFAALPGTAITLFDVAGRVHFADRVDVAGRVELLGLRLLSAAAWALGLLAIRWSYYAVRRQHGMGAGDVKLAGMLALWLGGIPMGLAFLVAAVSAAAAGTLMAAAESQSKGAGRRGAGKAEDSGSTWRQIPLPFGAFLCGGAIFAEFYSRPVLTWYMSFFR